MAEKKATKKETEVEGDVNVKTGDITYEDHGDHIVEIDARTENVRRTILPKAQRDLPVDKETREKIEERVQAEKDAVENEGGDPESVTTTIPPLKEDKGKDAEPEVVTVTAEGGEKS